MTRRRKSIKPGEYQGYYRGISNIYQRLEIELLKNIAKTLNTSASGITRADALQWQYEQIRRLQELQDASINTAAAYTRANAAEIRKQLSNVVDDSIFTADQQIRERTTKQPVAISPDYSRRVDIHVANAYRNLSNKVNAPLLTGNNAGVNTLARGIITDATASVLNTEVGLQDAIREASYQWASKGIPAFTDAGGRTWGVDSYVEMSMKAEVAEVYRTVKRDRMRENDVELVLVSSLDDPREICAECQGQVLTLNGSHPDYDSVYDYDFEEPHGLQGINCRHDLFPYEEGVTINNEEQHDPEEAKEKGRERDKLRSYERQIRSHKRAYEVADALGDAEAKTRLNSRISERQAVLRAHVEEHELRRQRQREQLRY